MCRWLIESGRPVLGRQGFEVGTGHLPVVPIGFYLCGAAGTISVDLNRRIDWELLREALRWITTNRDHIESLYTAELVEPRLLDERLVVLSQLQDDPARFLEAAGILYLAPQDAAKTSLAAGSIDCHYSVTVLEHIPEPVLRDILTEAKRLLKDDGVALHFIDPSDHFSHQDSSIHAVNFLKYSDEDWWRLADNRFAYCNRLRASDFLRIVGDLAFEVVRSEALIDEAAREALRNGFVIDPRFRKYDIDDLSTTSLRLLLKK
jgi:SAM-dependent methyltransferase